MTKTAAKGVGKEIVVPADLRKELGKKATILAIWKSLTPLARRDWMSWIESAKQPETRKRRILQTSSKLAAGKRRPCCYAVVPMNLYKALGEIPKAKAQWQTLSADEKRDFADWIDGVKVSSERAVRVAKAMNLLVAGKRHP